MMSPVRDEPLPLASCEPPDKVPLRDDTDIRRVSVQLFTRWRLPRIEVRIEGLTGLTTGSSAWTGATCSWC